MIPTSLVSSTILLSIVKRGNKSLSSCVSRWARCSDVFSSWPLPRSPTCLKWKITWARDPHLWRYVVYIPVHPSTRVSCCCQNGTRGQEMERKKEKKGRKEVSGLFIDDSGWLLRTRTPISGADRWINTVARLDALPSCPTIHMMPLASTCLWLQYSRTLQQ